MRQFIESTWGAQKITQKISFVGRHAGIAHTLSAASSPSKANQLFESRQAVQKPISQKLPS